MGFTLAGWLNSLRERGLYLMRQRNTEGRYSGHTLVIRIPRARTQQTVPESGLSLSVTPLCTEPLDSRNHNSHVDLPGTGGV